MGMIEDNGWPFAFGHIPIDEFFVDYGYQRPSRPKWVAAKGKVFSPALVSAVIGNRRKDGRMALIDGQQRRLLCLSLGWLTLPTIYVIGQSYEWEADLFVHTNFERGVVSPYYRYRGMVEAKVPLALGIELIAASEGFKIAANGSAPDAIGAPGAIEAIYVGENDISRGREIDGPLVLRSTLHAIRDGWQTFETWPKAKTGSMIRGVARWIAANPEVPAEELARCFRHIEPNAVHTAAGARRTGSGSGKGRGIETVIEEIFRKHGKKEYRAKKKAA